jgi:tetratricopeptide (TPR) repeat protein
MKQTLRLFCGWALAAALPTIVSIEAGARLRETQESAETATSHHAAGMKYLQAGRVQEALAEFSKAVRLDRNHLPSLLQIADLLSSGGQVFEAYGVLQHAVSIAPASAEVHSLLGRCFSRMEKPKEARQEFRRALELNPNLAEPDYGLGVIELRQGRLAEARRHIETFLERAPSDESAKEVLARICFEMKDYDAALETYAQFEKSDLARANIQREMALTLLAAGRYAEAEQVFLAVLERDPTGRDALRGLFDSRYKRGAYKEAIEAMEQISKLEPRSCEPLLLLARGYRRLNQFPQAHQRAQRCLELEPDHAGAHFLMGWTWYSEGDLEKAKTELEQAVKSDPHSIEALYWLATVELRRGGAAAGLRHLEKAVSVDPEYASARYALAQAYFAEHRSADAKKQFEEFRRLKNREAWESTASDDGSRSVRRAAPEAVVDRGHLDDWTGFANYLLLENKPRDALQILKEAQKIAPEDAGVSLLTAAAYTETGEVDAALSAYAHAENHGPTALLFLGRGTLYHRLAEDDQALADLRRALSMDLPARKAAHAHLLVGSILSQRKHRREAEGELRLAIALDPNNSSAHLMLAETLLELGKPAEAARECRRNLAENPKDASARLLLARALLDEKREADAADEITRASQLEGESGRVLLARGRLAAAQGFGRLAIDHLGRAGQTDPSQIEAFYLLGVELLKSGRPSEAAVAFEKSTILDPMHAESWLELGKIYLGAKRAQAAVGYFQKAVNAAPDSAEAHYQLAVALGETARFSEAGQAARRAKALGHPSANALLESLAARAPH